jgi:hypothetical protein
LKYLLFIGEVIIVCVAIYIIWQIIVLAAYVVNKRIEKQRTRHKAEINERCEDILARAARTEAIILQERDNYKSLPEEYREQFLAKYDELEEKVQNIRSDVARIRKQFGNEVTYG